MANTNDENDGHDLKQTTTDESRGPRAERHFSGPTPIEQQRSATAESTPAIAEAPENLDTDFDDPRWAAELKKSRDMFAKQFAGLARHLDAASRIAVEIKRRVEEEQN